MRKVNFARALRLCPGSRHASTSPLNRSVQVTTLPNKLRVATENTSGYFSSLGLYIDAGARLETPSTAGVSNFVGRMAFKTTRSMSDTDIAAAMGVLGTEITCEVERETIMYQSSHLHKATPLALSLISETIQNSSFLPEELDAQRAAAKLEIQELKANPAVHLPEILHTFSYGRKGLGNMLFCPEEYDEDRVDSIDASLIRDFMTQWYRPERMVLAGAGMAHEELVELAEKHFSSLKSTPIADVCPVIGSTYNGGYKYIHEPEPEFEHIYIAFEGVGVDEDDSWALTIMRTLLGGGSSFLQGAPSLGMHSRLYTHLLSDHKAINECACFHHEYRDSSLFGLSASFAPSARTTVLPLLVHQLALLLYRAVPEDELRRAKNQVKVNLAMALESRSTRIEYLGQSLVHNCEHFSPSEMADKIDSVTAESLQRVAQRIFGTSGGHPTILMMGGEEEKSFAIETYEEFRRYGVGRFGPF